MSVRAARSRVLLAALPSHAHVGLPCGQRERSALSTKDPFARTHPRPWRPGRWIRSCGWRREASRGTRPRWCSCTSKQRACQTSAGLTVSLARTAAAQARRSTCAPAAARPCGPSAARVSRCTHARRGRSQAVARPAGCSTSSEREWSRILNCSRPKPTELVGSRLRPHTNCPARRHVRSAVSRRRACRRRWRGGGGSAYLQEAAFVVRVQRAQNVPEDLDVRRVGGQARAVVDSFLRGKEEESVTSGVKPCRAEPS